MIVCVCACAVKGACVVMGCCIVMGLSVVLGEQLNSPPDGLRMTNGVCFV